MARSRGIRLFDDSGIVFVDAGAVIFRSRVGSIVVAVAKSQAMLTTKWNVARFVVVALCEQVVWLRNQLGNRCVDSVLKSGHVDQLVQVLEDIVHVLVEVGLQRVLLADIHSSVRCSGSK